MNVLLDPANLVSVLKDVQGQTGVLWNPLNPLVAAAVREAAVAALRGTHASDLTVFEFNAALTDRLVQLSDPSQGRARGQFQPRSRRPERTQPDRAFARLQRTQHYTQRSQDLGARLVHEATALLTN